MNIFLLLMMKILFFSMMLFFFPMSMRLIFISMSIYVFMSITNINNMMNYYMYMNMDMISISLMMLSMWILILMVLSQFNIKYYEMLTFMFFMLNLSLMYSFSVNSLISFYFYFEWSLIPIFFIIMGWGYQLERLKSSFYLLMYTLFASLPMLMIILLLNKSMLTNNFNYLITIKILFLNNFYLMMFFMSFLVKFPVFFFHQWLPKAHVEAPVSGSMILAGILLKLGGYGIIRGLFFFEKMFFLKFVMMFSLFGGSILSIMCLMNSDMKVMIAYSSVVHMALIVINIFSKNFWSINGSMMIMLAHGICSSGMFSAANMMYERSHSRMIMMNKSNLNLHSNMAIFWFILCMANFGGPFTYNLLGEISLIISLSLVNYFMLMFVIFISFFSAAYSLILYSNMQQGSNNNMIFNMNKMNFRENIVMVSHTWLLLLLLFSSMMI